MSDLEGNASGFFGKMKKDPVPAIGMVGFFGVVAYSIFNYRRKAPDTKPSVYVIQTRVAAQGLVISVLALGAIYKMYEGYKHRNEPKINALHRSIDAQPHQDHAAHLNQIHGKSKHQ